MTIVADVNTEKVSGTIRAFSSSSMKRKTLKSWIAAIVAVVLLYYGSAWAVLHCLDHPDDQPGFEERWFESDHENYLEPLALSRASDCLDSRYHFESLATSGTQSSIDKSTRALMAPSDILFNPAERPGKLNSGCKILAAVGSAPPLRCDLSLYLSFSTLRI